MALTFILSDESINSYGTRILTAGIDLTLFKKNPIMLWMHSRAWRGDKDEVLPIGKWENIRIENGKLLADAVFDETDEFAKKIKSKVEQNILKMASIGINIIATSEDKNVIVQGQSRPTVIKCLITEASICDIGSNRNALRLFDEFGDELKLSEGLGHLLPLLGDTQTNAELDTIINNENMTEQLRERLATTLSLTDVSDEQIMQAIAMRESETATLRDRVATYERLESERHEQEVVSLVDSAISERRITAEDRERFLNLARGNFDDTKAVLSKMPAAIDLSQSGGDHAPKQNPWEARFAEIESNKKQ